MDGRVEGPVAIKQEDHASGHWHNFPAGLRLLVVDDDPLCLKVVEQMLKNCSYEVTTCTNATMALSLLRDKNTEYDLVLSDVYMPDMDGFKLLEVVGLEMDLPVIMMSSNGDTSNVLRGVTHGACDYLIKPVRLEELRNLWQHVVRRRRQLAVDLDSDEQSQERDDDPGRNKRKAEAAGFTGDQFRCGGAGAAGSGGGLNGTAGAGGLANGTSGGLGGGDDLGLDGGSNKKARVVWSVEMHQQFVNAVNQLGIDKAVPKKILEIMNVEGLTRENVASHLQKYRLYLKRVAGVQQPNQPRAGKQSPPAPQSPPPPPAGQPAAVAASGLPPTAPSIVSQQQQLPPLPGLLGQGPPPAVNVCAAGVAPNGQGGASCPTLNGGIQGIAATAAAGPQGASAAAAVVADGGGHSVNPGVASSHPMAAAAAAVAAGGFHGAGTHPAALLAANPMMAAAAGLNPLLGAMGGLGVGPLGAMKPLNGMGLPGLQAPLGLMPSLPGSGGPLGPMGLAGLTGLTNMASPLALGPMAGGLQQLAAANLMQGMAVAGMGQLPGIGMNGLMGTLPGVSLPGPQQHLFPPGPLPQHLRQNPQLQQQPEPKGPHHQGPGQLQPQPQQLPNGLQPQHSQQPAQQQAAVPLAQQQPTLSLGPAARPVLSQQHPQPPLLQPAQSHPPPPQLAHSMSLPSPSTLHGPQHQLQQLLLQQHQHQLLQHQHQLSQSQCTQPLQQLLPSAGSVGLHCGSSPTGLLAAAADGDPDAAAADGTLDLHPDLIGRIIEDGFGVPPPGGLSGPPGGASGCGGPGILDTSVVLADGDEGNDIAAVFGEMYGSGVGGGTPAGGLVSGLGGGMLGGGVPATAAAAGLITATDLTSLVTGVDTHRLPGDDDFLSYLLKG